jgi:hypothetical protein
LYSCWRFGGEHPAVRWRGLDSRLPAPPEPWPSRIDAFVVACAIHASQQERALENLITAITSKKKRRGR